jgi:hypothetical protein
MERGGRASQTRLRIDLIAQQDAVNCSADAAAMLQPMAFRSAGDSLPIGIPDTYDKALIPYLKAF